MKAEKISDRYKQIKAVKTGQVQGKTVLLRAHVFMTKKGWKVLFDIDQSAREHFDDMTLFCLNDAIAELNCIGYAVEDTIPPNC